MDTGWRTTGFLGNDGLEGIVSWEIKKSLFGFPKVASGAALGAGFETCPCKCDYRLRYCDTTVAVIVSNFSILANVITACGIVT